MQSRHELSDADALQLLATANEVADRILGKLPRPLAELVALTSETYNRRRADLESASEVESLQARLRFFLVRDTTKIWGPLDELQRCAALPSERWRVLDIGAGLGTTTIGTATFAARTGHLCVVHAIDRDRRSLQCYDAICQRLRIEATSEVTDLLRFAPTERYDLIVMGLVLNELHVAQRLSFLTKARQWLAPGGTLILLEPALKTVTRELHQLRDNLDPDQWTVFAPCLRTGPCPMLENARDWCHEETPFHFPEPLREVARTAGLRFERLTYSYLTLRADSLRLRDHLGDARIVGGPIKTKGKVELFTCDDHGRRKLVRLNRHRSDRNRAIDDVRRGDIVVVTGAEGPRIGPDTDVSRHG